MLGHATGAGRQAPVNPRRSHRGADSARGGLVRILPRWNAVDPGEDVVAGVGGLQVVEAGDMTAVGVLVLAVGVQAVLEFEFERVGRRKFVEHSGRSCTAGIKVSSVSWEGVLK